jgi:hypothetical protein
VAFGQHSLKVRFLNGDSWEKLAAMAMVEKHCNSIGIRTRFEFLKKALVHPIFASTFGKETSSYVGRDAENYPKQPTKWLNVLRDGGVNTKRRRSKR